MELYKVVGFKGSRKCKMTSVQERLFELLLFKRVGALRQKSQGQLWRICSYLWRNLKMSNLKVCVKPQEKEIQNVVEKIEKKPNIFEVGVSFGISLISQEL